MAAQTSQTRLLVDLSEKPEALGLSAFDLCILRVDAQVDLEAAHALGHKVLARVPLFEVAANSPAADLAKQLGVPLLEGKARGIVRLDATHPRWAHVVVHELVETAAERGFDGVVLAELDTISHDAERAAVLRVLPMLKSSYPDKQVFMEEGFTLLREARRHLDGILFIDEKDADSESTLRLERKIHESSRQGVRSYVVGFENPEKPTHITARAARIRQLGGVPFFTTPEIDGANLGPLQEISRRVLVLHSGAARETYSARVLHGSLEWLGYQVIYQDASQDEADWMPGHHAVSAVIVDQSLCLSSERQHGLAELVTALVKQKVPVLLNGQPWASAGDWALVSTALGLSGNGQTVARPAQVSLHHAASDLMMNPGSISPRTLGLRDVRLSTGGTNLLSIQAGDVEHSQVALTSWGGLWLDPLALEAGPQINPLPFLEGMLATASIAPVVDTTCLDGHRLLVTHISSEGYAETTDLPGMPVAAEAMLEKVVARYSLPMTVSISEADVRGWTPGIDARQAPRLQEAARTLFTLSHVEPASGTLSRPTAWEGKQPVGGLLNASALEKAPSLGREIGGSLAWLHRQFLGHGHAMQIMSWPQGSLPSAEAVAFSREMHVENIATLPTNLMAGRLAPLPARSWGGTESFSTLLTQNTRDAAGFIAEATRTGQRRWLSPVQVSLSFHDAASAANLKQVEKMLDWCASQPFQAITAGEYARIMRDAARTRLFQTGADRWIIVNEGYARTLRMPATLGVPDLAACTGVAGFTRHGDQLYIHTLGLRRTELVMRPDANRDYLRLASSTGSVSYLEANSSRALLQVSHTRPVEMSFEGIMPGSICQMIANGAPDYLMADTEGRIEFTVPSQATIQLRILPNKESAMR